MGPTPRVSRRRPSETPPVEPFDIRTSDGFSLRADVYTPPRSAGGSAGVAILAHALMARRSEFDRPVRAGLASFLVERGWRVVAVDFRGPGDSAPTAKQGGTYRYDDLVARDLPAVCDFARSRVRRRKPVVVVGHSLGGHVALAAQGSGAIAVEAIVGLGASVWLRRLEPSIARWLAKRAAIAAIAAVTSRVGRFPPRALRLGSDDESRLCVDDLARFARTGRWASADGRIDYFASLARVRVPVLQLVSEGDVLECPPECGARIVAACGGRHDVVRVARGDDGGPPPTHMGLVTVCSTARLNASFNAFGVSPGKTLPL